MLVSKTELRVIFLSDMLSNFPNILSDLIFFIFSFLVDSQTIPFFIQVYKKNNIKLIKDFHTFHTA